MPSEKKIFQCKSCLSVGLRFTSDMGDVKVPENGKIPDEFIGHNVSPFCGICGSYGQKTGWEIKEGKVVAL